jgi:FixJ family two-component response regulator
MLDARDDQTCEDIAAACFRRAGFFLQRAARTTRASRTLHPARSPQSKERPTVDVRQRRRMQANTNANSIMAQLPHATAKGAASRDANGKPIDPDPVVFVVDDDDSFRGALTNLLRSVGMHVEAFASAQNLLTTNWPDAPACIVLDVRLKADSGLTVQNDLARAGVELPIIFMTGYGDIPMTVQAMKAGAVDFLTKPFRDQDLLDAVTRAISNDRVRRESQKSLTELKQRFQSLSAREQQVMTMVAKGLLNKQIAAELGLSEITVKVHRGQAMKKMGARTLADLLHQAVVLKIREERA